MAKIGPYNQNCPVARTLDLVGDRWTLLIIRDLFLGKTRFSQFRESTPAPPPKLLSERLQRLERHGLIERVVYSQRPLRAGYRLTSKGQALRGVVREMVVWGLEHTFTNEEAGLRKAIEERLTAKVPDVADIQAGTG